MQKIKDNAPRTYSLSPNFFKVIWIKVKVKGLTHNENHKMRHNSKSIKAGDMKQLSKCSLCLGTQLYKLHLSSISNTFRD